METNKTRKRKNNKRKKAGILVLFCLFCSIFLYSGYMLLSSMIKNKESIDAYQELRTEVRSIGISATQEMPAGITVTEKEMPLPVIPSPYPIASDETEAAASSQHPSSEHSELAVPSPQPMPEQSENAASLQQIALDQPAAIVSPAPLVSMDFSGLKEINSEIIGWIWGENCNVDFPVLQTDNNSYYLTRLYNKESNNHGSIFMDHRCAGDFSDKNSVLYGHAMRSGAHMFGCLKEYKKQAFYEANPTMMLYTPYGDYLIELISGTVEDGNYEFVRFDFEDDDSFLRYIEKLRSRSTFTSNVEVCSDDQIITLCTCSYERSNARYMVVGRLVRLYE